MFASMPIQLILGDLMNKRKSTEGVNIDKNATYQPSAGFQPDWNAKHDAVGRPPKKDWSKKPNPSGAPKKAPTPRRDLGRAR